MKILHLNEKDNVGIVRTLTGLKNSDAVTRDVVACEVIPFGNKVALHDIKAGDAIVKAGYTISYALQNISSGSLVNEKNTIHYDTKPLSSIKYSKASCIASQLRPRPEAFMGYVNSDGSVGTRNLLAITTTVQCVVGIVERACEIVTREHLHKYEHVDGIVPLSHSYGCGVAINAPDAEIPIRTVRNIAKNPNFGDCKIVVGLGCEKLSKELLDLEGSHYINLQDEDMKDFQSMLSKLVNYILKKLELINMRRRVPCPLSDLVIGVQCGGSDMFSGLTANPLVGHISDTLVSTGGTALFSEITEVRDAIEFIVERCSNQNVFEKLVNAMTWYENYLRKGEVSTAANTTPGNRAGGLSNIREKALGSIIKSGTTNIEDVLLPGEKVRKKGLNFLAGPSSDFVCGTMFLAAGANLQLFTTGRGTPYNLQGLPTIKISSNTPLYDKWSDIIDLDSGRLVESGNDLQHMSKELLDLIVKVASGKKTLAEENKLFNQITLFNPAPIT